MSRLSGMFVKSASIFLIGISALAVHAQGVTELDYLGIWKVTLQTPTPTGYLLEIEQFGDQIQLYADGSPLQGSIQGADIQFILDVYDGGDALRLDQFVGTLENGQISGYYIPERSGVPDVPGDPVPWLATPYQPYQPRQDEVTNPETFEGYWVVRDRGIKKAATALTALGSELVQDYRDIDDPINRCMNPGLLRTLRNRPGHSAIDIFYSEGVLKIDYANAIGNAQRHVFLDGREFPEQIEPTDMGYSIGHWDGDLLEIETRGFTAMFYDSNGAPVSESAVLMERMWLDGDGVINREYTFNDPEHYSRPLVNSGSLVRRSEMTPAKYVCDPHLFYRNLDITDEMQNYFRRARSWR